MVTPAVRERRGHVWRQLREEEERSGVIPLPAVDALILYADRPPSLSLVAPGIVPGADHLFVDLDSLAEEKAALGDRLGLESLIQAIQDRLGVARDLTAILHAGGLDYEFRSGESESVTLSQLAEEEQAIVWGLLQVVANLGARHPDLQTTR